MTRRYSRQKKQSDRKTWIAFAAVIGIIAVVFIGVLWLRFGVHHTVLDPQTLCPEENGQLKPTAQTVVMIDLSDPLTPLQENAVTVGMDNLMNQLRPGTLLSVFVLSPQAETAQKPIFAMCKPRDGSHASEITENARLMRKRFQSAFAVPLKQLMQSLAQSGAADRSPIIEMLQSIAVNGFQKWQVEGPKNLVVYSDMIQYTPAFSMYNSYYSYEQFAQSNYAQEHALSLRGVQVQLNYFINKAQVQRMQNVNFWKAFFRHAGAQVTNVRVIGQ